MERLSSMFGDQKDAPLLQEMGVKNDCGLNWRQVFTIFVVFKKFKKNFKNKNRESLVFSFVQELLHFVYFLLSFLFFLQPLLVFCIQLQTLILF